MKTKILLLFILVGLACLPLKALAYERNFSAGSIIIPMDTFYQPAADGGQLEAYGLAYYLLNHQDQSCLRDAVDDQAAADCEHTVSLSWVINNLKAQITGIDLVIEDNTLPRKDNEVKIDAVVEEYNHAGGTTKLKFDTANGDGAQKISYRGSLFIVDRQDLPDGVEDEVYALINDVNWSGVNVHVAQVPFAAPVHRELRGTPPKIALMNDGEDKTKGNAAILESYLRLAGICNDSYEVVTPNEIAGYAAGDTGTKIEPILKARDYDFLWAPHWDATKNYDGSGDFADQDKVVEEIQKYLKTGKGLLAECASIETFEHHSKGHFLSDKGFGHNGVDVKNGPINVLYANVDLPYSQIGDAPAGFGPEGGHLHNWRPYQDGDPYNLDDLPDVSHGNSVYNSTVKRFTVDDSTTGGTVGEVDDADWDYFVGGYAYGNTDYGYVVYLGGHKYAECSDALAPAPVSGTDPVLPVDPENNVHDLKLEFTQEVYDADFTLKASYSHSFSGTTETVETAAIPFASDNLTAKVGGWDPITLTGDPLQIDFTAATIDDKGKKFENIVLRNTVSVPLEISRITLAWTDGKADLKIKKLVDEKTDVKHYDDKAGSASVFTLDLNSGEFVIDGIPAASGGGGGSGPSPTLGPTGCTDNAGCEYKNLAGVRYVLNTLFNIKYEQISYEYVRSAPIVVHPWLYQGSFEHPSYTGHFRRFNVEAETQKADWDTVDKGIKDAKEGNSDGRLVYTAAYDNQSGEWAKIDFDAANVSQLTAALNVDPGADEIKVIERLRGRRWSDERAKYENLSDDKMLGGIMHSAPVIVRAGDSRVGGSRKETAYVGDIYGMLHAINTQDGKELWAHIPSNLLGKLKNDRTDPNADADFAAVDGSPTARDIYWDHDGDGDSEWRTILVCAQGFGGTSVFALDVTDPADWQVLWEATDDPNIGGVAPGGGMGYAYRAALDKVKVPVLDANGDPTYDLYGYPVYQVKWMVYVATSFVDFAEDHGGINVFAFDLATGTEQWTFSSTYADSVNDIPGAVTTYDIDGDSPADRIYVGDMNGRMWELALTDDPGGKWTAGESVHTAEYTDPDDPLATLTAAIPLFNAGFGNPISVSPAITNRNGHVLLVFGTGGTDWASDQQGYHVYAVDATAAGHGLLSQSDKNANYASLGGAIDAVWSLPLAVGEKVWSSPTISAGQIWLVTSFGSMESTNPRNDLAGSSKLRLLDLDNGQNVWPNPLDIAKVRGSVFVSRKHVYMSAFNGEIIQLGEDNDFSSGTGNRVVLKSWQHQ